VKLRHAAALALTGWYLMTPPLTYDGPRYGFTVQSDAPLSKWVVTDAADSASECEQGHYALVKDSGKTMDKARPHSNEWANAIAYAQSQCIASNDPRLAK